MVLSSQAACKVLLPTRFSLTTLEGTCSSVRISGLSQQGGTMAGGWKNFSGPFKRLAGGLVRRQNHLMWFSALTRQQLQLLQLFANTRTSSTLALHVPLSQKTHTNR